MGKNNRARRAAKARQKARRGTPRSRGERAWSDNDAGPFGHPGPAPGGSRTRDDGEVVAGLWLDALTAAETQPTLVPGLLQGLARHPRRLVDQQAQRLLTGLMDALWSRGWQPVEVRRQLRIATNGTVAALAELAIHADHAERPGQALDPRWAGQIAALKGRDRSVRGPWLAEWADAAGLNRIETYRAVVDLSHAAGGLAPLDVLIPPPGAPSSAVTIGSPLREAGHHPMLERVRKLLAKAEATDFEEEAASLTAKAQELMTRHAIDEALLHRPDAGDVPRMVRVPVDAPYADAKSFLLGVIADANRCRAVFLSGYHMSSLLGHAEDLALVEMLFTSLLVQAQKALTEAGRGKAGRRARSASFRSSFLLAYADRISERLASVNATALDEDQAASALPVLRAKEDAVEELFQNRYGDNLVAGSVRGGYDYLGQAHGRQAADAARLDAGALNA